MRWRNKRETSGKTRKIIKRQATRKRNNTVSRNSNERVLKCLTAKLVLDSNL
jgi:hypothetical protein